MSWWSLAHTTPPSKRTTWPSRSSNQKHKPKTTRSDEQRHGLWWNTLTLSRTTSGTGGPGYSQTNRARSQKSPEDRAGARSMSTGCHMASNLLAVTAGPSPVCGPQTPARSQQCVACVEAGTAACAPLMVWNSLRKMSCGHLVTHAKRSNIPNTIA